MSNLKKIIDKLPGKDCGLCGFKTCNEFAEVVDRDAEQLKRCVQLSPARVDNFATGSCGASCPSCASSSKHAAKKHIISDALDCPEVTWKDNLGREYDFVLDKYPGDLGPRETILLFNPANVEKLKLKKGDIIFGRPGWISCGCPVTHAGIIVEEPDYFNGTVVWCVTGPLMAREGGINIGGYNTTAYEGLVHQSRQELQIGMRYYFLPRFCMLQWRHCGLMNTINKTSDGLKVRIEGLYIG